MIEQNLAPHAKTIYLLKKSPVTPSRLIEYVYYGSLFYMHLGPVFGISFALLGAVLLAGLAGWCIMRLKPLAFAVYSPIALPLACGISFVAVQVFLHDESIMENYIRGFITWILTLIVVQSLALRKGFFHRFVLVIFVIGLMSLPLLKVQGTGVEEDKWGRKVKLERLGLDKSASASGELANPNGLAGWFGFCAVYFLVVGIESRRTLVRLVSWLFAAGNLLVVGLTVSRGALIGVVLACVLIFYRLLKRGFLCVLILTIVGGLIFLSGLFKQSSEFYLQRGGEETGRGSVWPLVIERFLVSPLTGVGVSNIGTRVGDHLVTPHNGFLFIGLSAGVIPLVFFMAYWWRAARGALRLVSEREASAPYYLPLFVYSFVYTMLANDSFTSSWVIVTLSGLLTIESKDRLLHMRKRRAIV